MLSISNLSKSFGDQLLFSGVSFTVSARDRLGVIGANGSGKTTLFSIITGNTLPDTGTVSARKGITIGYLSQEIEPSPGKRLLQYVAGASTTVSGLAHRIEVIQSAISEGPPDEENQELLNELGELQHRFEAMNGYNAEQEAKVILAHLGFKEKDLPRTLSEFSGGWLMRAELARLLVINPDRSSTSRPTTSTSILSYGSNATCGAIKERCW